MKSYKMQWQSVKKIHAPSQINQIYSLLGKQNV